MLFAQFMIDSCKIMTSYYHSPALNCFTCCSFLFDVICCWNSCSEQNYINNLYTTKIILYYLSLGRADGFYSETFEFLKITSHPVLLFYRGTIKKIHVCLLKSLISGETKEQTTVVKKKNYEYFVVVLLTWMFPCSYLNVSQFYIIGILIQKFARETQNFVHLKFWTDLKSLFWYRWKSYLGKISHTKENKVLFLLSRTAFPE